MFVHTSCCECAVVRAAEPPGVMPVEQAAGRGPLAGGLEALAHTSVLTQVPFFLPFGSLFLNPHQVCEEKGLVFVGVTLRSTVSKRKR